MMTRFKPQVSLLLRQNHLRRSILMTGSNRYDTASQLLRVGTPTLSRAGVLPYVLAEAHKRLIADPAFGKTLAEGLYQSWFKSN